MSSHSSTVLLSLFATGMLFASGSSTARACTDAGPGNQLCNDGGAQWILCDAHSDCPEGQLCGSSGVCTCGDSCGAEECDENGCHCCGSADAGCSQRYVCEGPGGGEVDAGGASMDGGVEPAPSSGCSIGTGTGVSGVTGWALVVMGALALHRRRAR